MRRKCLTVCLAMLISANSSVAVAWNETGHRIVAFIAYQQLDDATRDRVFAALRAHPAMGTDLWTNGGINGPNEKLNAFLNAATFPDDVRFGTFQPTTKFHDGNFKKYHKKLDHYINFPYTPPDLKAGPVSSGENILESYKAHIAVVKDANAKKDDQAVALSWIFHQIGDIHQPLHATTRIGLKHKTPEGDGGGNLVAFPNPRGHKDMHSYWDDLLGSETSANNPAKLKHVADLVVSAYPRTGFKAEQLKGTDDLGDWATESFDLAVEKTYGPLGDDVDSDGGVTDLPEGFEDMAQAVAKRRLALAGYRLAEELKTLYSAR
jgi:S1/P1 Nuclease